MTRPANKIPPQTPTPAQLARIATALTNLPAGATLEIKRCRHGEIEMTVKTDDPPTKAQLLATRFAALQGQGITISDAAQKYDIPRGVVSRWVYRSDNVRFVDTANYPQLVDEAEVALCAQIYHQRQAAGLTGVPYFDDQGRLIVARKHPLLAEQRAEQRKKKRLGQD